MAEILIYAKVHWMETATAEQKAKWDDRRWAAYERRLVKGNPIIVKPDGWKWGKRECPPDFVVLKIPGLSVEEADKYTIAAFDYLKEKDELGRFPLLAKKRYQFDTGEVNAALISKQPIVCNTKQVFLNKLDDKEPLSIG